MATITASASMRPRESCSYDDVSMEQSMILSDSLEDLKNLSKELYSAAEYFELSYMDDNQKEIVANTLKDYAVDAIVNTVDHLGHATFKVSYLLDEKVDEVSENEFHISCMEQRLRRCQYYIDLEGLSQQSLMIKTPKYHKRYILPVGETINGAVQANIRNPECSLNVGDDWNNFRNARATTKENDAPSTVSKGRSRNSSFSSNMPNINLAEHRTASPPRFPFVRPNSHSSNTTSPKCSRPSTPNRSRTTIPTPSLGRQMSISEPRKSASMHLHVGNRSAKDGEQLRGKSIRLLKALLSRSKPKKDEMLYTYLNEY
ncbi:protein ABIL3-like isoform X1 [Primulina eburnea]|uniref:protein ABIL3-like isoform X1 n=1 Tax=Primulina eburnea TaxID=1245227 RepID=UPI003C6CA4F6